MTVKGFRLTAATGIHKGDREYQQDQVALLSHPRVRGCVLGVLADGMGGRSGGRKASDQVILTARQLFERYDPESDDAEQTLKQLVQEAHMVIRLTAISAEQEPHSTLAAFLIHPSGQCHGIHCGDSRIYHFHGKQFIHRSKDHSYVQKLVEQGVLSEESAKVHPKSNLLLACLGMEKAPDPDLYRVDRLQPGDSLLLCSDGLWHYFSQQELGAALDSLSPREASEYLIDKARIRAQGGGDNLSLAIVKLEPLQS